MNKYVCGCVAGNNFTQFLSPWRCPPAFLNKWHFVLVLPCPDVVPLGLAVVLPWGTVFLVRALGITQAQVWDTLALGG